MVAEGGSPSTDKSSIGLDLARRSPQAVGGTWSRDLRHVVPRDARSSVRRDARVRGERKRFRRSRAQAAPSL
eukprot:2993341-Prymnesium_polylepis.1